MKLSPWNRSNRLLLYLLRRNSHNLLLNFRLCSRIRLSRLLRFWPFGRGCLRGAKIPGLWARIYKTIRSPFWLNKLWIIRYKQSHERIECRQTSETSLKIRAVSIDTTIQTRIQSTKARNMKARNINRTHGKQSSENITQRHKTTQNNRPITQKPK